MKPRPFDASRLSYALATALAALLCLSPAHSAIRYWEGGTGNWVNSSSPLYSKWSTVIGGTTDPTSQPGSSDDLIFNTTAGAASDNVISHSNGNRAALSLTFNTSGTSNFRAGGASTAASTLTIGSGGITLNSGSGAVTIGQTPGTYGSITVALGANQIWTNNSTSTLTVTGAVTGASRNLTKAGTGTVRLNGANTYSGTTSVTGGILQIGNYAGLDDTSSITVSGGGNLQLVQVGSGATTNSISKSLSLAGTLSTAGGTSSNTLALTWAGAVTLAGNSTISNNGNSSITLSNSVDLGSHQLTFQADGTGSQISGSLSGTGGSLVKTSAQVLTLSGTNTYTGTTTISSGRLQFAKQLSLYNGNTADWTAANLRVAGTLGLHVGGVGEFTTTDVTTLLTNLGGANGTSTTGFAAGSAIAFDTTNAGGSFTISDVIADSTGAGGGALGLTKVGSGSLVLANANTFTGTTTISSGILRLENAAALQNSSSVVVSGGTLQVISAPTFAASALSLSGGTVSSDRADAGAGLTHDLGDVLVNNATQTFTKGTNVTSGDAAIQFDMVTNASAAGGTTTLSPTSANLIITGGYTGAVNGGTNTLTLAGSAAASSITGDITLGTRTQIDVIKSNNSVWTLSGNNTGLAGTTTVNAGALITTTLNALPNNGAVTFNGGAIAARIGGAGWTTAEVDNLLFTATKTSGQIGIDTTNGDLTQWTDFTTSNLGALGLAKFGTGTLTLNSALNDYTGTTLISQGTLKLDVDHTLSGGLTFGYANGTTSATGILDLNSASGTFGGLTVNGNSPTASEVQIGSGELLTINGNVQIGAAPAAVSGTITQLDMNGGGVFNVATAAGGTFRFGANADTSVSQDVTLDLTDLSATTINTSDTGTIRVNSGSGTNVVGTKATLLLPTPVVADTVATATLTAGTIVVGNGGSFNSGAGQINTLQLGTGLTTLNANTISVGTGLRDLGQIIFGGAGGDLIIRAADGVGRATALNVGAGGGNTGTFSGSLNTLVDFSGHDANILVTSLSVGSQNRTNSQTYEFKFGEGDGSTASVLDATNVSIGIRTNSTNSTTAVLTGRVDLSGGTVTFGNAGATGNGVLIGNSAYDKAGAASAVGELNISGGNVTIHNGAAGFAVRLGSNVETGGGTVTASMNLTGGMTTLGGDIVKGATAPRTTSSLTLNGAGATLDMGGNDITGVDITYTAGTLRNLGVVSNGMTLAGAGSRVFDQATGVNGEIQGAITGIGVGLTKQGDGKLTLSGSSSYDGPTMVSAGTLFVTGSLASSAVTVDSGGTIGSNGAAGTLNNGLSIIAGGKIDLTGATIATDSSGVLGISGGSLTLADLTFEDILGWDWLNAAPGTYEIIEGTFSIDFGSTAFVSEETAYEFGNGKKGYFTAGSLNVVIIPEPRVALLGGLGLLMLLRRRR